MSWDGVLWQGGLRAPAAGQLPPMRLNILSDRHVGFGAMDRPVNDANLVVLAGDISRPREAVAWALRFDKPVLYVPGSHEFYGGSIDGGLDELQRLCECTQVRVLSDRDTIMGGVRFLGTTLLADFELFDDPQRRRHHPLTGRTPVGQRESRRGGNSAGV